MSDPVTPLPTETVREWLCRKRNGQVVPFDPDKIRAALRGGFNDTPAAERPVDVPGEIETITTAVLRELAQAADRHAAPADVEHVQRRVIKQLWARDLFAAAEAYQNYRETRRKLRDRETAPAFDSRAAFKPFDYTEAVRFKQAIQKSAAAWTASEFDFVSDSHDMRVHLTPAEQSAAVRSVLAISQIEVDIKKFWKRFGDRMPRAEFDQVGVCFADSEVRHADAYSKLLDATGLNDRFRTVTEVPAIARRIQYIADGLKTAATGRDRDFAKSVAVFALLIENVSLFSQFAVVKSFARKTGRMQNLDNTVQATIKEELVHATFGAWVTNLIRAERPDWFGPEFYNEVADICRAAVAAENDILDWIFAEGPVRSVSRPALTELVKERVNVGIQWIGGTPIFDVDAGLAAELDWFREELVAPVDVDFFHKKATTYTTRAVTAEDLFG